MPWPQKFDNANKVAFRSWTLTTIFVILFAAINQFFGLRYVRVTPMLYATFHSHQITAFSHDWICRGSALGVPYRSSMGKAPSMESSIG